MNKPSKQIIPCTELLEKIQSLLVCYREECRNIHIDGIQIYRGQVDGANWGLPPPRCSGDDHDWPECWENIAAEIGKLRECYDVAENELEGDKGHP